MFCASRINNFLSHLPLGQRTIEGCLEAYSCKYDIQYGIINFVDGKDDVSFLECVLF